MNIKVNMISTCARLSSVHAVAEKRIKLSVQCSNYLAILKTTLSSVPVSILHGGVCTLDNAAGVQARTQIKNSFSHSGMKNMSKLRKRPGGPVAQSTQCIVRLQCEYWFRLMANRVLYAIPGVPMSSLSFHLIWVVPYKNSNAKAVVLWWTNQKFKTEGSHKRRCW